MPHFDEFGGDMWMCQGPNHRGNRQQNSRVDSTWFTPVPDRQFDGNLCPACASQYPDTVKYPRRCAEHNQDNCLLCWLDNDKDDDEPLNSLDYADNPAELELQRELRRIGIKNSPTPSSCPDCKGPLTQHDGMAGEMVLACPYHGIVWEDAEGAIRNVF